jgi:hypothetical protein
MRVNEDIRKYAGHGIAKEAIQKCIETKSKKVVDEGEEVNAKA